MDLTKRKDAAAIAQMEAFARERDLPIVRTDKGRLNSCCGNRPHQGVVLQAEPLETVPLTGPPPQGDGPPPVWLALDEVTDPQNLGALLRSAYFLGVDGVIVSAKNTAPLSPTVSKASAGAMELMTVHSARNMVRWLGSARAEGWQVLGTALEQSITPDEAGMSQPTILVLGSEGRGLRTSVLRECDAVVRVPRRKSAAATAGAGGADNSFLVDSLNVSVAGALLMQSLLAARDAMAPRDATSST